MSNRWWIPWQRKGEVLNRNKKESHMEKAVKRFWNSGERREILRFLFLNFVVCYSFLLTNSGLWKPTSFSLSQSHYNRGKHELHPNNAVTNLVECEQMSYHSSSTSSPKSVSTQEVHCKFSLRTHAKLFWRKHFDPLSKIYVVTFFGWSSMKSWTNTGFTLLCEIRDNSKKMTSKSANPNHWRFFIERLQIPKTLEVFLWKIQKSYDFCCI